MIEEVIDKIVIDTKIPAPDSQFRLRPCRCGCENIGYLQIRAGAQEPWVVRCFRCGAATEPFLIRHDAQIFWNTKMAVTPRRSFSYEQT